MSIKEQSGNDSTIELSGIQKLIGKRMLKSKREQPCFYLSAVADLTQLNLIRRKVSKKLGARLTTNDFFFCAMSRAVEQYPLMAGRLKTDQIIIADKVNVGFAVAAPQGLVVPVIKAANELKIAQIAQITDDLTKKARSGNLLPDDMTGACITLSSLGMYGCDSFIAVLPPDVTSILAIGKISNCIESHDYEYQIRKTMKLSLSADNRIINEHYAASFLNLVVDYLKNPDWLIE